MSFYQKYRPKKISDLNLSSVKELFLATMESGNVSHAYLFVGPRGSGKTSAARILAKLVNCEKNKGKGKMVEPCGECNGCRSVESGAGVDIIEIDAASNGLVEDIRDLREKARLSPIQLAKKVYIIDEVHMVSSAGFNALLKTLEEPPKHVMFILCTTEAHKVPETILSRCAKVSFSRASMGEMIDSLKKVIDIEGLDVTAEALAMIVDAADGSFREGHKLLEQLANFGSKIDETLTKRSLGLISRSFVKELVEAVINSQRLQVVEFFNEMEQSGVKAMSVLSSLLNYLKNLVEEKISSGESSAPYLKMISVLIETPEKIRISPDPLLPLEVALLGMCEKEKEDSRPVRTIVEPAAVEPRREKTDVKIAGDLAIDLVKIKEGWGEFINEFAGKNVSLASLLRQSEPTDINGKAITLSVRSKFQQDMLERDVKKKLIEEAMEKTWGPVTFKTTLNTNSRIGSSDVQSGPDIGLHGDEVASEEVIVSVEEIFG